MSENEPQHRDVEEDLISEFKQMGIHRPVGTYGYFPQSEIDRIQSRASTNAKVRGGDVDVKG